MNRAYFVWNISKTGFDPEKGIIIHDIGGGGGFVEGFNYTNLSLHRTLDAAIKKAEDYAKAGTVGVIFEVLEAHVPRFEVFVIGRS